MLGIFPPATPVTLTKVPTMSFLNTLKTVAAQKAAQLSYPHALHTWPVETRQRYLAAVAAGTAVDRDVQPIEKETFYTLASNLGLSDQDAAEQLSGRASLSEHDVHNLSASCYNLNLGPFFCSIWLACTWRIAIYARPKRKLARFLLTCCK